jgi:hypothetical protein
LAVVVRKILGADDTVHVGLHQLLVVEEVLAQCPLSHNKYPCTYIHIGVFLLDMKKGGCVTGKRGNPPGSGRPR